MIGKTAGWIGRRSMGRGGKVGFGLLMGGAATAGAFSALTEAPFPAIQQDLFGSSDAAGYALRASIVNAMSGNPQRDYHGPSDMYYGRAVNPSAMARQRNIGEVVPGSTVFGMWNMRR